MKFIHISNSPLFGGGRNNSGNDNNRPGRTPNPSDGRTGGGKNNQPIPKDKYHPSDKTPGNAEDSQDNGWRDDGGYDDDYSGGTGFPDW